MNISFDWLKEYVDIEDMTPQELDDLLTFSGLEVDSMEKVETIKGGLEHVVIAQVLTCEPHPDSDHLHLTTVDVGGERPLNIVCGAPNVAAGQKVVCAQIGTKIYTSDTEYYEIKKGKLRGAVSEGMLCAADELQLGTDHAGIMVLPDDAPVGMPAKEYFHVKDDCLLEVAITANRMDAISHIGVARDVVAVRNTREGKNLAIKWPEVKSGEWKEESDKQIKVTVEEPDLCPRYTGITLRNVKVGESRGPASHQQRGGCDQLRHDGGGPAAARLRRRPDCWRPRHREAPAARHQVRHPRRRGAHPRRPRLDDMQ